MMNDEDASANSEQRGLDRILALSDGVFAFALTLLVLSLAVPALKTGAFTNAFSLDEALLGALSNQLGAFFSYAVSFFVISVWWVAHQRVFRYIRKYDAMLLWRNLFFLLFVTIIPFLTELLNQFENIQVAVAIYNLSQAFGGLALSGVWSHASKKHLLVTKSITQEQIDNIRKRGYVPSILFLVATGLVFLIPPTSGIYPSAANVVLFAMFPLMRLVGRKSKTKE